MTSALATWDMLRKYRGQLAAAGIGYDDLPRPAGAGRAGSRTTRASPPSTPGSTRSTGASSSTARPAPTFAATVTASRVTLAFPYDPDLVAACRAIPGRRYDGAAKANVFPFTSLPAVIKLADAHQIEVTAK